MSSGRGAKGSIKDRLISMLYRFRYKKKTLKESNYSIDNKNKQKNYIDNLKEFEETENLNILDNEDKTHLDKVNYVINFKVNKKGLNDVDLKLHNIESKNSELVEPVNLKKETKKINTEITILKEVDSFIKKSITNIQEIKFELDELKKETKEKNKDYEKIEDRYNKLKQKINKLKKQYESIKDKYDFSDFSILESIKLMEAASTYKTIASLNEIDMMLKVCKKEISKIDNITIVVEENKKVGTDIENTKKEHENIKIKFNKSKEKINKIKDIEKDLSSEIKYQQKIVDDMYKKASFFEKNIRKSLIVIGRRDILGSIFRIAGGILTLPLTGRELFGVALGSTLINKGLKEMNKELETKEKITISYNYEDISKQVEEVKDKIEYINLIVSDSLNEIKKLKNNFKNEYIKYDNILPEYKYMMDKLNSLEDNLNKQQEKLLNMDKKLEKEKEINKQKLKKIGK